MSEDFAPVLQLAIRQLSRNLGHIRIDRVDDGIRVKLVCEVDLTEVYCPNNVGSVLNYIGTHLHPTG